MLRGESPPLYIYSFLVYFTKVKYTEISYIYCPPPLNNPSPWLRAAQLLPVCCRPPATALHKVSSFISHSTATFYPIFATETLLHLS